MSTSALAINLEDRTAFRPGEPLSVGLAWDPARVDGGLEFELLWRTEGRGSTDRGCAYRRIWSPDHHGDAAELAAGVCLIDLTLPDGPWTYRGHLISVVWAFTLRDAAGDDKLAVPIELHPDAWPPTPTRFACRNSKASPSAPTIRR